MWTAETRAEHDRDDLRYPSDLTDAEWQILASLLPPPAETGRHRCWPMREVMNAIFFVLREPVVLGLRSARTPSACQAREMWPKFWWRWPRFSH